MPPLTPELEDFILTRIDMLFYDINEFDNINYLIDNKY